MTDLKATRTVTSSVDVVEPAARQIEVPAIKPVAPSTPMDETVVLLANLRSQARASAPAALRSAIFPQQRPNAVAQLGMAPSQSQSIARTAALHAAQRLILCKAKDFTGSDDVTTNLGAFSRVRSWMASWYHTTPSVQAPVPVLEQANAARTALATTVTLRASGVNPVDARVNSARIVSIVDRELAERARSPGSFVYGRTATRRVIRSVPAGDVAFRDADGTRARAIMALKTYRALGEQQRAWGPLRVQGVRPAGPVLRTVVHYETRLDSYRSDLSSAIRTVAPRHPGLRMRVHYEGQTVSATSHSADDVANSRKVTLQLSQADGTAATRAQVAAVSADLAHLFRRGVSVRKPTIANHGARLTHIPSLS